MAEVLSAEEVRVVGALIEKQLATPQYYPLTLNALVSACNQSSNRNPVVAYDDATVADALASMREKGLTRIVHDRHNRAAKYRHVIDEVWRLDRQELAVLGVLMLRGPQTVGELRARTERLAEFEATGDIEAAIDRLALKDEPLALRLGRLPGQKEARVGHLLSGEPPVVETSYESAVTATPRADRLSALEEEVRALRVEVDELRARLNH